MNIDMLPLCLGSAPRGGPYRPQTRSRSLGLAARPINCVDSAAKERQTRSPPSNGRNEALETLEVDEPTDEVEGVVKELAEILLAGIGGRKLLVEDAARLVESWQIGCDVEDARNVEPLQRLQIGGVASVAQKQERQDLSGRMRIHVGHSTMRRRRQMTGRNSRQMTAVDRRHGRTRGGCHDVVLAQVRIAAMELVESA